MPDSLLNITVPDSLARMAEVVEDSMAMFAPAKVPLMPAVEAADIFGPLTSLPTTLPQGVAQTISFHTGLAYQIPVLLLGLFYFFMVLRYSSEAFQVLKGAFALRSDEHDPEDYNYLPAGLTNAFSILGMMMIGTALVRMIEIWLQQIILTGVPAGAPVIVILSVIVILIIISLVQRLLLRLIGEVTFTGGFTRMLAGYRKIFFCACTLLLTPLVLFFALAPQSWAVWIIGIFLIAIALLLIYYLFRSLRLFLGGKVSILLWILYLCTIEIMPLVIPVLSITRSM